MRTIKFKAKRVDNGEWVFGDLLRTHDEHHSPSTSIFTDEYNGNSYGSRLHYEVIAETVCQFTGLLDKNGVEIFEGDLFQVANNQIYTVKFSGGHEHNYEWFGGCFAMFLDDEVGFPFDEYAMENGVVTGNIHDK